MSTLKEFPVEKEYEKNLDISREDIKKLREWLKTQPHLPEEYISELDLVLIFFCCDKSSEVSKQVLDLHFTLRTIFLQIFKDREVNEHLITTISRALLAPLPTPTIRGYKAVYCRLLDFDPKHFVFTDVVRAFKMIFDLWQYEEGTWPGFVLIIDLDSTTIGHLAKVDLMTLRQVLYFLQECMLVKLKEVHFLNAPGFMDKLLMLLKPFLKRDLLGMIKVHEVGSDTIYKYVPKKAFPKEFGGEFKSLFDIRDDIIRHLKENSQYFVQEKKRRVNESLRPGGKEQTIENLFGIQGSFKKLDID